MGEGKGREDLLCGKEVEAEKEGKIKREKEEDRKRGQLETHRNREIEYKGGREGAGIVSSFVFF